MAEGRSGKIRFGGRLATLILGITANQIMVIFFNWVLYPFVIWKFGIIKGGIIMTFLSFIVCYITLLLYDYLKKDWLGIELIKSLRESNSDKKINKILSWAMKKGNMALMIFLSIKFDPFITIAYMRKGFEEYNGLTFRDWKIFILSIFISNFYWTFAMYFGITLFKLVVKYILGV